jgi:hypothetical protein
MSGSTNNALARDTLILHPPDKSQVLYRIISSVKPRPKRISLAFYSALNTSISYILWYTAEIYSAVAPSLSKFFSFSSNYSLSSSVSKTVCKTVFYSPKISCSTKSIYTPFLSFPKSPLTTAVNKQVLNKLNLLSDTISTYQTHFLSER